jgi:hypothetical protein
VALSYVQTANATGPAVTITGVAAGNLLVWCGSSGSPVTALSDDRGDTWLKVPNDQDQPGVLLSTSMWYTLAATSGTHVVTRTGGFGGFENYSITEAHDSGGGSWALDQYISANYGGVTTTDPDSGLTGTTAVADEFLIGCIGNDSSQDNSGGWQDSFTSRGHGGGISRALDWATLVVAAAGTYRAKATSAGTQAWQSLIATFKATGGGGGGGIPLSDDGMLIFTTRWW